MAAAATPAAPAKKVLVAIGTGSEEMEAVIITSVLRRAGAEVTVASVEDSLQVTLSRGVKIVADESIATAATKQYDLIALPGGMPGAERLRDSAPLEALLHAHRNAGKPFGAICATPAVFLKAKGLIAADQKATSHPIFSDLLQLDASITDQRVVVDGQLTTSRSPGTAIEFALSLVRQLYGEEKVQAVAGPMLVHPAVTY